MYKKTQNKKYSLEKLFESAPANGLSFSIRGLNKEDNRPLSEYLRRLKNGKIVLNWDHTIPEWSEEIKHNCSFSDYQNNSSDTGIQDEYQCHTDNINESVPEYCELKKCTKREMYRYLEEYKDEMRNKENQDDYYSRPENYIKKIDTDLFHAIVKQNLNIIRRSKMTKNDIKILQKKYPENPVMKLGKVALNNNNFVTVFFEFENTVISFDKRIELDKFIKTHTPKKPKDSRKIKNRRYIKE